MTDGVNIVGVQFRRAGRIYDFLSGDVPVRIGDDVVVETERGPSLAKVASLRFHDRAQVGDKELKTILRVASARDLEDAHRLTPEYATKFAKERADKLGLKMTVLQSDVQFGGNKVIIYFSAAGRVDFRDLVKELAGGLRSRVELKQVGARDEAKLVGGIGICGREFCCSSFLRDFVPVSIKMAKNQNLALNPTKVSGGCGRLLCCLTYENDLYSELRRSLPPKGVRVRSMSEGASGRVLKGDILNQLVLFETDDGRLISAAVADLEILDAAGGAEVQDEGDDWGEDINLAAIAALEDDDRGGKKPQSRPPRPEGREGRDGRRGDRGERGGGNGGRGGGGGGSPRG